MKITILFAAGLSLSACSATPDADAEATDTAPSVEPAAVQAPQDRSGAYEVTAADGTKWRTTIGKDGTYSADYGDGKREDGTVADSAGQTCFDKDGDGEPRCWTLSEPDAAGAFSATDQRGERVSVVRSGD
ncbi:hypothetical protein F7D01_14190 [Erythrobacter sp. 3-20A1M]|uniref:hypothetical protein n=1 Tax=Erythrobacter sp. 3-20A1M TaxID=2653850 RepID=UPI001BFCB9D8|nr:hypothetical protein [Erythrobacter sp. 3-20A1M]QWC58059.1 hypothetical protein F7D01_14190 [Erythrobacter sp. 3-20A1M]